MNIIGLLNHVNQKDNKYRDYYIWRPGKEGKEPNNWEQRLADLHGSMMK